MPCRDEISERRLVGVNVTEHKEQLCVRRAVLHEQNALPCGGRETSWLTAKDDIDNVGAGRAATGAFLSTAPEKGHRIGNNLCPFSIKSACVGINPLSWMKSLCDEIPLPRG